MDIKKSKKPTVQILGISFIKGKVSDAFNLLKHNGGLMTVPAAPALVTIKEDNAYYESLLKSDLIIPDSGYMILIWNIISKKKLYKISGLEFIEYFTKQSDVINQHRLMLVNPSEEDGNINKNYLVINGFNKNTIYNYTAPFYNNNVTDDNLLKMCEEVQPKWIMINIGGGTQEKLGLYLKENLSFFPAIMCTGAAISFKTGRQVKMPLWIDHLYLGWLARCISKPKVFIPRYLKGFKLLCLILKYKSKPYES